MDIDPHAFSYAPVKSDRREGETYTNYRLRKTGGRSVNSSRSEVKKWVKRGLKLICWGILALIGVVAFTLNPAGWGMTFLIGFAGWHFYSWIEKSEKNAERAKRIEEKLDRLAAPPIQRN